MYTEFELTAALTLWRSRGASGTTIPADGCVDFILREEDVFVAGPSTRSIETLADGEGGAVGLRFSPGAAHGALGINLSEIKDRLVALSDVASRDAARHARAALLRASGPSAPNVVSKFVPELGGVPGWSAEVRRQAHNGTTPGDVAKRLGWTERTFRRRMLEQFGYSYLTLVRINRAANARALLKHGASLSEAAAVAGYADQPHLSREFRRLVGTTPGQFCSSSAKRSIELPSGSSSVA